MNGKNYDDLHEQIAKLLESYTIDYILDVFCTQAYNQSIELVQKGIESVEYHKRVRKLDKAIQDAIQDFNYPKN